MERSALPQGTIRLVGVVIALIALLTTLLSGLANGLVDDGISGLRQLRLTHLAFQPDAKKSFSRSELGEANLKPWQNLKGAEVSALGVSFLQRKDSVEFNHRPRCVRRAGQQLLAPRVRHTIRSQVHPELC